MRNFLKLLPYMVVLLLPVSTTLYAQQKQGDVSGQTSALTRPATNDVSNLINDAVVLVNDCSGTLIAPNLVITSAHCLTGATADGRANWTPFPVWRPLSQSVRIRVGNDRERDIFTTRSERYTMAGWEDIAILELVEDIPANKAIPARVLTRLPNQANTPASPTQITTAVNWLRSQEYVITGWGGGHRIRRVANASFNVYQFRPFGDFEPNMMHLLGANGATLEPGDSGSPAFAMIGRQRYLVGVAQGIQGQGGRYIVTFGVGSTEVQGRMKPDIGVWINNVLYQNRRNRTGRVPLFSWYNERRTDNFISSDPRWVGNPDAVLSDPRPDMYHILNQTEQQGYKMYRLEGYVFDPRQPQPRNTVPLYSWWNPQRTDNFATTDPRWDMSVASIRWAGEHISNGPTRDGYTLYRLEGYIYSPREPQPRNTVPLYSWWNPQRTDNFATTDPTWRMNVADIRWTGEHINNGPTRHGYTLYRLEGYLPLRPQ
ncbi:MAG TPA: trypsin-like serine protease [Saprospiraceae bacterium]|nr:trypsin-like serine protease [Saprospiraceae bacterium]HMP23113.1 trypsin-like serine protease [Saprospiraceae bacterium]